MFTLQRRLQMIKRNCMKWCLDHKKEVGLNWAIIKEMEEIDSTENKRENQEKTNIRRKIEQDMREKLEYYTQRAKSRWDDWGDKSTGFFFRSVKTRASKNEIRAIKNEENQWTTDEFEIQTAF
ncbi:LINE-1 retrotransposable element ORF2 protein [Bienertia sinuspersici]